jgi:uncharacterized protein
MEIASKVGGLRVLPIDDSPEAVARMQKVVPVSYVTEVMPGPSMEGIAGPTKVYAFDTVQFTHAKVSDDIVYKVTRVIYENKQDLVSGFAGFNTFFPRRMATLVHGLEFHPGALKFYKEAGLWPAKN